jgi:hypothetical protein
MPPLLRRRYFSGDDFLVEEPAGSHQHLNLSQAADELAHRPTYPSRMDAALAIATIPTTLPTHTDTT